MKIIRTGVVIIGEGPIRVENWVVERGPDLDPEDATLEQLLLGYAIHFARTKLEAAVKDASMDVFRAWTRKQAEKVRMADPLKN